MEVHGGKRAAAELVSEVERGGHRASGRHTVADLLEQWMAHIEAQGRARSTLTRYRSAIDANIVPLLGRVNITKVGPAELDGFYAQLAKAGLSPLTVRKSHAILSAAFHQALKWGWVDRNPVERVSPLRCGAGRSTHRPWTSCAGSSTPAPTSTPISAASSTSPPPPAPRRGELCGLRWDDLDLDAATLTIARSISDAGRIVSVKDTNTHQTRRIALNPTTVRVLRDHRRRVEERARAAGVEIGPFAYVWPLDLDTATPYRPDRVTGAFRTLRDRLDMPHVTFHALRRFTATTLAAQGTSVRTIAGRLGHANPGITLRTYAHFLDAADGDAATAIDKALGGVQQGGTGSR